MTTKWHQIAGKWKRFSDDIKKWWSDLAHEESMKLNGHREILVGTI